MEQGGRLSELQQFAARGDGRRAYRGSVIRALAAELTAHDELDAIVASRPATGSTVALVTSGRVLVARQATPQAAVTIEAVERSGITAVTIQAHGGIELRTATGATRLTGFATDDIRTIERLVAPVRRRTTQVTRAARRKHPVTDLQMIATLLEAGVLTDIEHEMLRTRLLARIAAHEDRPSSDQPAIRSSALPR